MFSLMEPGEQYKMSFMDGTPSQDLANYLADRRFSTVLADPPWRFAINGKSAMLNRHLKRFAFDVNRKGIPKVLFV